MADKTLESLFKIIKSRKGKDAATSYTAKLFEKGTAKIAQKVGEEAVETVIAAMQGDTDELIAESADLLFHLLVLWADAGISIHHVAAELESRKEISGIEEKKSRQKE